ncbi:MAG TPA: neutral zinc metallopeptidase [Chitinophagaceae bacterium]|nr:neutral zinc metallopeptidase [Chitinophagaceae bacterium]
MDWKKGRTSKNVQDRRGKGGKVVAGGSILVIVGIVLSLVTGQDFTQLFNDQNLGTATSQSHEYITDYDESDSLAEMVSVMLASTEDVWTNLFQKENLGMRYQPPELVLFSGQVNSACGAAGASMGPFYCPADQRVFIDLTFCDELRTRFNAPGNFAIAYVIGHEVGHHIQHLLGIAGQVQSQRGRLSEKEYNKLSVKLELQADFLAGVWAYHEMRSTGMIEDGDLQVALNAASAIGDDNLQMEAQGYVVPDAFTHGTSQQRMYWFKKGFDTGNLSLGAFNSIQ